MPSFRRSFELIARWAAEKRRMMLVYRINMLGMQAAAELFGIPNGRVVLQPCAIKSHLRPPWPMSQLTQGRMGSVGRKVIVPALYRYAEFRSPYRRHMNLFRKSVGLTPQPLFHRWVETEDFILMMCPKWFARPQDDWPKNTYIVGFPFAERRIVSATLKKFIQQNGSPIVFTPGTGVTNTAAFFDRASEAVQALGIPGIFLSRFVPERHRINPRVACQDYADLAWLLPQSRGFFHHGGIGSTAEALRAGIPQIIIPDRFDQPDNAMRVASLALGAAVLSNRYSGRDWADLFNRASRSEHIKSQLSTAAHLLANENGIANSIAVVDHFIKLRHGNQCSSDPVYAIADIGEQTDQIWSAAT